VKEIKFVKPVIVEDELVKEPPPAIDDLEDARISMMNKEGVKDETYVAPPLETQGIGAVEPIKKPAEDFEKVFLKVEKEAQFPGGLEAWKKYLERTLNANIAVDDGAPTGNYTVKVRFIVDREGGISNVQAFDVPASCPGCGSEAVRVIKRGPRWEPAIQNGKEVVYQAVQSITFQVSDQ
jgi:protein TonB